MRSVTVSTESPEIMHLLDLASEDNLILRTPEGREFVLADVDDFDREVELVRQNDELMEFLDQRSLETTRLTLSQVREKLNQLHEVN